MKLVDDLVVTASKSMRAVTGLAATLLALNNKELFGSWSTRRSASTPGMHCTVCDRLYETDRFWCGHCGKPLQPVDDLIELMAERLIRMGRRIEQVRGEAAQHLRNSLELVDSYASGVAGPANLSRRQDKAAHKGVLHTALRRHVQRK